MAYLAGITESITVTANTATISLDRTVSGTTATSTITGTLGYIAGRVSGITESISVTANTSTVNKQGHYDPVWNPVIFFTANPATVDKARSVNAITEVIEIDTGVTLPRTDSETIVAQEVDTVEVTDTVTCTITPPLITGTVNASDSVSEIPIEYLSEAVEVADTVTATTTGNHALSDAIEVTDSSDPLWLDQISDTVTITDTDSSTYVPEYGDSVNASDSVTQSITYAISESVNVSDSSDPLWQDLLSDSIEAADSILADYSTVNETVSDSVEAADALIHWATASQAVADVVEISDTTSATATINELILDTAIAQDFLYSPDPSAIAWIMNTETGAPSFYLNYNFHDIVFHNGKLYGAAEDGLYLLEGADDAGTNINTELITGFLDFDNPQKKRLPYLYFGYTGGELECDVETYDQPNDIQTFGLEERETSAPRNIRLKIGKGLISRYWRFTLHNISGSAFKVYDTNADVVSSKRRL